jgi:hypothetical protein
VIKTRIVEGLPYSKVGFAFQEGESTLFLTACD